LNSKMLRAGVLSLCVCVTPRIASAQTMQWTDKGFASLNGGVQVGSHNLTTSSTFDIYGETATVQSSQKVKSAGLFDLGGAYRVWGQNLLAGVFFSHTSSDTNVTLTSSIPDPLIFGRLRNVTSSQSGAKHSENVVNLDAIWMIPIAEKLDVGVFGGPSIFFIKQDTVGAASVTEPGPTVSAPFNRVSKTTGGLNLGADVQYMLGTLWGRQWGVGGTARYTWGSVRIDGQKLTVGGFQLLAGGRYRF